MSTVAEIEQAINQLPKPEFWKLADWFDEIKTSVWDAQMEADARAGRLDFLFEEAAAERQAGSTLEWPAQA